jgi:hypothetical protein
VTGYFTADVETVIGRERRPFDAEQANYHLEVGGRVRTGRHLLIPFFHHVSRHRADRPLSEDVVWNLLGLRAVGPLPGGFPFRGRYAASVAYPVQSSGVDYRWEITGLLDAELLARSWGFVYLRADARFVTVTDESSRGAFLDFLGEGGLRFVRGGRSLDVFAAYEHRNDVFVHVPGAKDRALLGLRIGFAPGAARVRTCPSRSPGRLRDEASVHPQGLRGADPAGPQRRGRVGGGRRAEEDGDGRASPSTLARSAPRAMRTPISRVLRATE